MTLTITAGLLGAAIAGSILFLVRRGHLHGIQAVWWLLAAGTALALGLFPQWVDAMGRALGVAYPPMLLVVLAVFAILIKMLITDIELARKERRLRRLTQKLALMEYELRQAQGPTSAPRPEPAGRPTSAESPRRGVG